MGEGGLPTNLLIIIIAVMLFVFCIAGIIVGKVIFSAF
jgi:hypothetical protein